MPTDPLVHVQSILAKAPAINTIAGKGGIAIMRRNLRAAVRGLWSGALSKDQALRVFRSAMENGIDQAWNEGAAECGIQPDELTVEELIKRDEFIFDQNDRDTDVIDAIVEQSKANGGSLTPLLQRNEMWVNQYPNAKQQSEILACGNGKRMWKVGATEHCRECMLLDGQVRRLQFWKNNVVPRNPPNTKISCGGWACQCTLVKTDKPITRGKLPRLAR